MGELEERGGDGRRGGVNWRIERRGEEKRLGTEGQEVRT